MTSPMTTVLRRLATAALIGGALAPVSCSPDTGEDGEPLVDLREEVKAPLSKAYCQIKLTSKGLKDTEGDYLPHVIACENGNADAEALKAQAIAARSVAYYNMATKGSICDSQECQVYSCDLKPQAKHYEAVKATEGMYLSYAQLLTYGFYVNGSAQTDNQCHNSGTSSVNKYITYNDGKTGANVKQSTLGYVSYPIYGQNRGCMSQFGAMCLEKKGNGYLDILKFYYGEDIQVLTAAGSCVSPPSSGGACIKDTDCTGSSTKGVICTAGACKEGCRDDDGCASGKECSSKDGTTAGTCSNTPGSNAPDLPPLGSDCTANTECNGGQQGTGHVCGSISKKCILGCGKDTDCASGGKCDKSDPRKNRCVSRREIGQSCSSNQDCNGGVDGTTRICVSGTCEDGCQSDKDCTRNTECNKTSGKCQVREVEEEEAPTGECVLNYPSISIQGIPIPASFKKEYTSRGCGAERIPTCVIDLKKIVDAKTKKTINFKADPIKLSPNYTLRELVGKTAAYTNYVYVSPQLVEGMQRTRDSYGFYPITSAYRSPQHQNSVCHQSCGKSTCKNSSGSTTCAGCSDHMTGKALDAPNSNPLCALPRKACNPGKLRLIWNEKGGTGVHLHVDYNTKNALCTYKSFPNSCK
ncbi:MAG: hypothetical protein EOO74_01775 [Myxococcales bacterium]|nr:MAG: hypothetical protein EOO74_01775 [Myxococcales bacterium]